MKSTERTSIRRIAGVLVLAGAFALTACSSSTSATWVGDGQQSGAPIKPNGPVAAKITSPADGATDIPAGTEIAYTAMNAAATTVDVTDAAGQAIEGAPGPTASTWVPKRALAYGTEYTAKITATGTGGKTATSTVSFTTMAKPSNLLQVHSFMGDGQVFGVAAPVVLTLSHGVADADRAAVQKRLSVTSIPTQVGAWSWISDHEIHYRPKEHWQTGTKLFVNIQTGGVPMGNGWYGGNDLTVDASITSKALAISIDDKKHKLTVTEDGKVVKTMPASLGKPSTPSSSGEMVIMTRKPQELFDSSLGTGGTPINAPGGYRVMVKFTMRLTWDGQFIHAAPWSVNQQGHTDVSHGCTNVSTANAKWIYEHSHVGDPVSVRNTGHPLPWADGWTDWNVSWDKFIEGSALPIS